MKEAPPPSLERETGSLPRDSRGMVALLPSVRCGIEPSSNVTRPPRFSSGRNPDPLAMAGLPTRLPAGSAQGPAWLFQTAVHLPLPFAQDNFGRLSVCLSIYLSIYLPVCCSVLLFIHLPTYLSVCPISTHSSKLR